MNRPTTAPAPEDQNENQFPLSAALVTTPEPLTVSRSATDTVKAAIEVVLTNHTDRHVPFDSVTLSFNAATTWNDDAGDLLTPVWGQCSHSHALPSGWSKTKVATAGMLQYSTGTTKGMAGGETLWVRLYDVPVSAKTGATEANITLDRKSGSPTRVFTLGKFPADYLLKDLKASVPVVQRTKGTVLTWVASHDPDVTLSLFANGLAVPLGDGTPTGHATGSLTRTTVYELLAVHRDSTRAPHSLVTTVHVLDEDLVAYQVSATAVRADTQLRRGGDPAVYVESGLLPDAEDDGTFQWTQLPIPHHGEVLMPFEVSDSQYYNMEISDAWGTDYYDLLMTRGQSRFPVAAGGIVRTARPNYNANWFEYTYINLLDSDIGRPGTEGRRGDAPGR